MTSTVKKSTKAKNSKILTDSSSDDSDTPSLDPLRLYKLQKQVDKRIKDLECSSHRAGNDRGCKLKSKRGGNVDVTVKARVAWPHEPILGGSSRQHVTYNQLTLTQWVQGFCKNIMEEPSRECRYEMISYMSDLMEDATDFTWQGAKAKHTVMSCEMERGGVLTWEDTDHIDRIRRAHAQKRISQSKFGWVKNGKSNRKPWFCKNYQNGSCSHSKDHDTNGKLQKHILHILSISGETINAS